MNSADQIGQLNALRFKIQTGNKNLLRERSDGILENEIPGMGKENPKEELTINTVTPRGKLKLKLLGNMGLLREFLFGSIGWGPLMEGRFVYAGENKPISADHAKNRALRWRKYKIIVHIFGVKVPPRVFGGEMHHRQRYN